MWEATIPVETMSWHIAKDKQPPKYTPIVVLNPISNKVCIYVNRELHSFVQWLTLTEFTNQAKSMAKHACSDFG